MRRSFASSWVCVWERNKAWMRAWARFVKPVSSGEEKTRARGAPHAHRAQLWKCFPISRVVFGATQLHSSEGILHVFASSSHIYPCTWPRQCLPCKDSSKTQLSTQFTQLTRAGIYCGYLCVLVLQSPLTFGGKR